MLIIPDIPPKISELANEKSPSQSCDLVSRCDQVRERSQQGAMSDRDLIMFGADHNREKHTWEETELKRAIVRNDPDTIRRLGKAFNVNKPCTLSGFEMKENLVWDHTRA